MSEAETKDALDWARFTAAYFPGRRRHDMEALTAYGTYRRARVSRDRPSGDVQQTAALAVWEDEGGPVL
jgi:hypothetical protein